MCYRCFWPQELCWCSTLHAMETSTRFVFLMHPKEFKQEKAATGRLTRLCLANSDLFMGMAFDDHEGVQTILRDPANLVMLAYPGAGAVNLSTPDGLALPPLLGRRLVILLLDATWSGARKMLRLSRSLQRLPRVMFTPTAGSRYVIKQQPQDGCLSTLETVHELLLALEQRGLDRYAQPEQLLGIFQRMQEFQLRCASDPTRTGYRRRPYSAPAERERSSGESRRRRRYLKAIGPAAGAVSENP
ncbi:MAG TPA: tRNA-uridine aminocarboxypropyltransferase [Candidatus Didemnitutus sp.]|nr:tRNA-uridine aminocarboxypropyltransferase [Candidatus Didemnitutus sp.]